jgi:hypothetical protein
MEMSGQLYAPAALSLRKETGYPMKGRPVDGLNFLEKRKTS